MVFCDEKVIAAYGGRREYDDIAGAESYFDYYHDLAYHVTEGERIVLETEHYYISLDVHGVSKYLKTTSIKDFEKPGEWLEPFIHTFDDGTAPWVDYESTLFVGERLLQIENKPGFYLLRFDDFDLKIVPHTLGECFFPWHDFRDREAYFHIYGAERHIKNKCSCGGDGELLLDFVCDYVVRCRVCKKSTWALMNAQDAIEEWNRSQIQCDLSDITIL